MMDKIYCDICGAECIPTECTTGYGRHPVTDEKHCFKCCGLIDEWGMQEGNATTLYLTTGQNVRYLREGRHNWAGVRYDVWFTFAGHNWHGTQYGDNTQLCHCKPVKA